jgi:hypothetical protein
MTPVHNIANALRTAADGHPSDGHQDTPGPADTPGPSDALGDRGTRFDDATATSLQVLRFKPEFGDAPGFENALRASVEAIGQLQDNSLHTVREVGRFGQDGRLALVSERTDGQRLSELMSGDGRTALAIALVQELGAVLAVLHQGGHVHGALTPERIVVPADGRPVIVEHVLGAAITSLGLPGDRLRSVTGMAVPKGPGPRTLDPRLDVIQLGFIVLSLLLGQHLDPSDYPDRMTERLDFFSRTDPAVAAQFRPWLERALQIGERPFATALDALAAFEGVSDTLPPESDASPVTPHAAEAPPSAPEASTGTNVVETEGQLFTHAATRKSGSDGSNARRAVVVLGLVVLAQAVVIGYQYVEGLSAEAPIIVVAGPSLAAPAALLPSLPVTTTAEPTPADAAVAGPSQFGGVTLAAPIDLQVFKDGKLLGSTGSPIALAAGTHVLEVVNEALGYRGRRTVQVEPGHMASIRIILPKGRVSINAAPWAEVLVDGVAAGETPLANLELTIGEHEITFRHPQFDEQRQTAVVNVDGITRVTAVFQQGGQ